MIGLVIVSHCGKLAEGVCELARQVGQGRVAIAAAGGTGDADNPLGTDAMLVLDAIEQVYSEDGVLVLMDLGSAVLSAETALELLGEDKRAHVRLCAAPLVEGAVAAASLAAAGATMEEVAKEAANALAGKVAQLGGGAPKLLEGPAEAEAMVVLSNPFGLHARPAARLIRLARGYKVSVTLENVARGTGPAPAASINAILSLAVRQGHKVRVRANGFDAQQAVSAIAAFLEGGCGEVAQPAPENRFQGISGGGGIAIGPLHRLRPAKIEVAPRGAADADTERQRLMGAIEAARQETRELYEWSKASAGPAEAGIFDAQMLFLEDSEMIGAVGSTIELGQTAESAWQTETDRLAERLGSVDDAYLRARAADVADVAARVLRRLTGQEGSLQLPAKPSILAAHDLTPGQVKDLDPSRVLGICLESGSASAHSAILARAMGIPLVAGLGPALSSVEDGTSVALDAELGKVWIAPAPAEVELLERRRREWLATRAAVLSERQKPAGTRDGRRVRVLANISGVEDAAEAVSFGAEGVGVLRTEFLFLGRAAAPSEDEQAAAYQAIAESLGGRTLCIRALDIGGDKGVPYIEIGQEANPFLGWRGIRVLLGRRDLLRTQVRAILRVGEAREVELLLPMIASLDELRQAKAVVQEAKDELRAEGIPFRENLRVGVMIEVPAAAAAAGLLAREADFFSIGSNDLIQYVMAADRTNSRVASIADPFQPAVLAMINQTVEAARHRGIEAALCGELAADPLATPLLLGLGLDEFSVSAPLIPELKRAIAALSRKEAEEIAEEALSMDSAAAIREFLKARRPSN